MGGLTDETITAHFDRASNSASVWSPTDRNIVVHLLDDDEESDDDGWRPTN